MCINGVHWRSLKIQNHRYAQQAAAQNYSKSLKIGLWMAKFIYPIIAFRQTKAIFDNMRKGLKLGRKAEFLLGYRSEDHWQEPIKEVRKNLGLPPI